MSGLVSVLIRVFTEFLLGFLEPVRTYFGRQSVTSSGGWCFFSCYLVLPSFFFSIRYGSIRLPTNWQSAKSFSAYYRVFLLFLAFGFDPTGCATASLLFFADCYRVFFTGFGNDGSLSDSAEGRLL